LKTLGARRGVDQRHRIEVAGDRRLGLLVRRVDEPHDEEEAHQRGHEVGEGDLPDAAVMAFLMVVAAAPDDDDLLPLVVGIERTHDNVSASRDDHSASRVSKTLSSIVTERSKLALSAKSNCSA